MYTCTVKKRGITYIYNHIVEDQPLVKYKLIFVYMEVFDNRFEQSIFISLVRGSFPTCQGLTIHVRAWCGYLNNGAL